jgi:hypothetical protein
VGIVALTPDPLPENALDLDLAKADLRIAHVDLDELIWRQHLPAAIERAEGFMNRSVVSRRHVLVLDSFPYTDLQVLTLPRGLCSAVTSIAVSQAGVTTTYRGPSSGSPAGTDWQEDLRSDLGARLMPKRASAWPGWDIDVPAPIVVTYTVGWASTAIPQTVCRALVAAVLEALDVTPDNASRYDMDVPEKLLSPYRLALPTWPYRAGPFLSA